MFNIKLEDQDNVKGTVYICFGRQFWLKWWTIFFWLCTRAEDLIFDFVDNFVEIFVDFDFDENCLCLFEQGHFIRIVCFMHQSRGPWFAKCSPKESQNQHVFLRTISCNISDSLLLQFEICLNSSFVQWH